MFSDWAVGEEAEDEEVQIQSLARAGASNTAVSPCSTRLLEKGERKTRNLDNWQSKTLFEIIMSIVIKCINTNG